MIRLAAAASLVLSAPAAAQTSGADQPRTGPISGYMEVHLNAPVDRADGDPILTSIGSCCSSATASRIVFGSSASWSSNTPLSKASGGRRNRARTGVHRCPARPSFNLRGGMVLTPVGIINERHEPPVFYGVERPFVDTVIIPTTWFEAGAGTRRGRIGLALPRVRHGAARCDRIHRRRRAPRRHSKGSRGQHPKSPALTGRVELRVSVADARAQRLAR